MGIRDLWNILEQVKQETSLADFRGKKLAVDFSSWFVKCEATPYTNRSIFYRIVDLMSNGITPVFVFDGPKSPEFKARKRGESYFRATSQWKELLNEMGFPTLYADGEAEKACAQLNSSKAVVGCVTDDGDVFAYGATTVLKDYRTGSKEIHLYELSAIEEKIGIGQKEMIAAAILIGCDYHKGVESVGREEFKDLLKELRNNEVPDIIDRNMRHEIVYMKITEGGKRVDNQQTAFIMY